MKRKLFAITLALALLTSAYTAWACFSTRGLRVYLMGTQMGAVFAGTWQYTFLAAAVLWIPGAAVLLRRIGALKRRRAASPQSRIATEIISDELEATELLEPRGSEEETELLEPRSGGEAPEKTESVFEMAEPPAVPVREGQPPLLCPNCGHPVAGKKFCAKCGTKVGG